MPPESKLKFVIPGVGAVMIEGTSAFVAAVFKSLSVMLCSYLEKALPTFRGNLIMVEAPILSSQPTETEGQQS